MRGYRWLQRSQTTARQLVQLYAEPQVHMFCYTSSLRTYRLLVSQARRSLLCWNLSQLLTSSLIAYSCTYLWVAAAAAWCLCKASVLHQREARTHLCRSGVTVRAGIRPPPLLHTHVLERAWCKPQGNQVWFRRAWAPSPCLSTLFDARCLYPLNDR